MVPPRPGPAPNLPRPRAAVFVDGHRSGPRSRIETRGPVCLGGSFWRVCWSCLPARSSPRQERPGSADQGTERSLELDPLFIDPRHPPLPAGWWHPDPRTLPLSSRSCQAAARAASGPPRQQRHWTARSRRRRPRPGIYRAGIYRPTFEMTALARTGPGSRGCPPRRGRNPGRNPDRCGGERRQDRAGLERPLRGAPDCGPRCGPGARARRGACPDHDLKRPPNACCKTSHTRDPGPDHHRVQGDPAFPCAGLAQIPGLTTWSNARRTRRLDVEACAIRNATWRSYARKLVTV